MGDVVVERAEGVVDHRAVAGPDGADLVGLGQPVQPVEGVEVGAELPVGVRDDGGAAPQHGVAGEHRLLGREHERQRVGGVPGRGDDPHLEAVDLDDVAAAEALGAEAVLRVQRAYAAPHPLGELLGRLGVVEVVMGQEYDAHVAGQLRDRVEMGLVGRTRGRSRSSAVHPARAGPRCWCRRASSCWRSARARTAPRSPNEPPVQLMAGPRGGARTARAPRGSRRRRSPRPAGVNISTTRPCAAASTAGRVVVLTHLEAGQVGRRQHEDLLALDVARRPASPAARSPGRTRWRRRGCAGPRAGRRRRTRCGSAAARRPASASRPRRRAGRCAAPARGGRGSR